MESNKPYLLNLKIHRQISQKLANNTFKIYELECEMISHEIIK